MLDSFAGILLAFSHDTMMIPLVVLGYIWLRQNIFYQACCLLLLGMLVNYALKVSYAIPLDPKLGIPGFAFPSGHMQASCVFYGWIASRITSIKLKVAIAVLLIGIAYSLVHFGYHNYSDILGAVFFAALLLYLYCLATAKAGKTNALIVLTAASLCMLYIFCKDNQIKPHLWLGFYALNGFVLAEKICARKTAEATVLAKTLATILCFTVLFAVHKIMAIGHIAKSINGLPSYITQLQWLISGAAVPCSSWVANNISRLHCCRPQQ